MWLGFARTAVVTLLLVLGVAPLARAHEEPGTSDPGAVTHRDTPAELADGDINDALATGGLTSRSTAALPESLPTTWCGSRRLTDDTADAAFPALSAQVKFVYAYASGQPDRSAQWSDSLQGDVSRIAEYLAQQSGGRRSLRFDMGTECGSQYVDIQVVALPHTRSYYVDDFDRVADDVRTQMDFSSGPRNLFIVADDVTAHSPYGTGEVLPTADQAGPGNAHNGGGFAAIMWVRASTTPDASDWQPTVALHEITHNLGAVAWSAPHTTHKPDDTNGGTYSHCWDGQDVMCYDDGPNIAHAYDPTRCPLASGTIPQTYDCGHDDYFDPAPAGGSYLATHWNVYDSDFMGACTQLQTACGGNVVPTPPVNEAAPAIAGTPQRGAVLIASAGSWLNTPSSYSLQWQRAVGPAWSDVPGATAAAYVPTTSDVGGPLRVLVTAANADGAALAASAPTAPIADLRSAVVPQSTLTVRIRLRDRSRRTAGTLTAKLRHVTTGREVKTAARRVTLRAGTWRLRLCAGPVRGSARCTLTARVRSRGRIVRLPAARVVARTTGKVRVTAAVVDARRRVRANGQAASV
jgi:hypothetical protein